MTICAALSAKRAPELLFHHEDTKNTEAMRDITLSSYRRRPVSRAEMGPGLRRDDE
jgi:hypothetical protein